MLFLVRTIIMAWHLHEHIPIPMKSRMTVRPSAAPFVACVHRLPKLKRRIRKVPGVPIMSVARGKYVIERLPDAPEK